MDFLGQTGADALKGADILRTAPEKYASGVEYAANPIAQSLKSVAQTLFADLGDARLLHPARQASTPTPAR